MTSRQKKFFSYLLLVTVLALFLRVFAGWHMYQHVPGVTDPISATDMETYIKYGKQFKNGTYTDFNGAYYYQPFYYAVYLNGLFRIFGESTFAIVMSQAFLGALTVFLTGLIGALVGGRKVGLWAAVILALFRNHILYTPYALIAVLQTFFITLVIYFLILGFRQGKSRYWIASGLVAACSILCRGNFLLIIPFILALIFWKYRFDKKQALLKCCLFMTMVYLPQLPFSLKNYQVTGKWTGPSTAGGIVLAIGNNPDASPGTIDVEGSHYFHFDQGDEYTYWMKRKDEISMKQSIVAWVKEYPLQWLDLKFRTLLLYISNEECYNNITLQGNAKYIPWLNSIILLDYWLVGIPFLVFVFSNLKRVKKRSYQLIIITTVIYIGSTILFYVLSRYKLPIIPLMAVVGVIEIKRWYRVFRTGEDIRRKVLIGLGLIVSTFAVSRLYSAYEESCEVSVQRWVRPQGNYFETPDFWLLKDHNNSLRGGWDSEILSPGSLVVKSFAGGLTSGSQKGSLRFFAGVESMKPEPIRIFLEHNGMKYTKDLMFNSGWIEIEVVNVDTTKDFKLAMKSVVPSGLFYTTKRNFGRSIFNESPLQGEWIMQLKVFKEK